VAQARKTPFPSPILKRHLTLAELTTRLSELVEQAGKKT